MQECHCPERKAFSGLHWALGVGSKYCQCWQRSRSVWMGGNQEKMRASSLGPPHVWKNLLASTVIESPNLTGLCTCTRPVVLSLTLPWIPTHPSVLSSEQVIPSQHPSLHTITSSSQHPSQWLRCAQGLGPFCLTQSPEDGTVSACPRSQPPGPSLHKWAQEDALGSVSSGAPRSELSQGLAEGLGMRVGMVREIQKPDGGPRLTA